MRRGSGGKRNIFASIGLGRRKDRSIKTKECKTFGQG